MPTPAFSQIEGEFARLSPEAQLNLLERLVHRTRLAVSGSHSEWETDLAKMAADPQVQEELSAIDAEFRSAEADGLRRP